MFSRNAHTPATHHEKGPSLARGPAWIVGTILSVFGLMLFFKAAGTPLPTTGFPDGEAQGQSFLGFEANAWTAWLTTAAGVLVLLGAAQHALAKTMSLLVGLALGAMSVIALFDGEDVFGLAAANGLTKLGWGIAAAVLIVTALLPRLGRGKDVTDASHERDRDAGGKHDRDLDGRDDRTEVDHGRTAAPVGADTGRDHATAPTAGGTLGHDDRTEVTRGRVVTRGAGAGPEADAEPEIVTDDQRTRGWPTHADDLASRQNEAGITDPASPRATPNRNG